MAIFWDAQVDPDELTVAIREVPTPAELALLAAFPIEFEDDNTIDFAEIVRTNRTARYRSWDGRVHVSERDTGSEKRVKMIPLSDSLNMGEYERLQLEFAKTGGTRMQALAAAAYNDARNLTRNVLNRLEQAWGDVYADGKLTIAENGYAGEADYGVPGSHIVAPAGALWSNLTTAVPLTDLQAWSDIYEASNGTPPEYMRTSRANIRRLQRNKEVIDAVYGSTQGRTRVSLAELNELLESEGLPSLRPAYETKVDVDGVTTRTLAEDKVVLEPADLSTVGATKFGVSVTALEMVRNDRSDMTFEEAPGIVGVIDKGESVPYREATYVDCVAMPYLKDGKKILIADVA